ncbi:MAG TPA: hypothetical protein VGX91_00985 [Candidatus Cybelea sp.]|jgi:hypothetical protein|nr:hypothetical protein [Candidatus Cybelea sp.]
MTVEPSTANGWMVTAAHPNRSALPRYAELIPDRPANSKIFEYIINDYGTYAGIFDYPESDRQIGSINDVGGQGCANVLYGYGTRFWIVAGPHQITEYKVPHKAVRMLSVHVGMPSSCAMDTKGDLAVGILNNGDLVIFKHARGPGKVLTTPLAREYFDGYDTHENLFFDGFNPSESFELVELLKGSNKLQHITTSNTIIFPGSVQWDGKYLTVTDQDANAIYQYTVKGTTATLEGTVTLSGAGDCAQTWIGEDLVFCADAGNESGEVYKYPQGGSPVAVLTGNFDLPLGTVAAER